MIVYYIVFLISSFFLYVGERKTDNSKSAKILWALAGIIPALLAGVRAESVGSDTSGYIKLIHDMCSNNVNWKLIIGSYQCEIGYYFINFIVTRITESFQVFLFIIQLLILVPVLYACKDNEDLIEPHLSYLFFLMLFYNRSLNMCRQSIAISFCMFSVRYIRKQKFSKFAICIVLAMSIHRIAFVFFALYIMTYFLLKKEGTFYKFVFLVIAGGLLAFYQIIINKLMSLGYIGSHYSYYVNGGNQNISSVELGIKCLFITLILLNRKNLCKKNSWNNIFIFFLVLDILVYCLGFYANYAQRISYYIGFFEIYLVPQISNCVKKKQRIVTRIILLLIAFAFSYIYYGVNGCDGTVPYKITNMW